MNAVTAAPGWYPRRRDPAWTCPAPSPEALTFHRGLDDYAVTPLVDLPTLAVELGVARVLVKDESSRLGLPAFKALGASWALHRALRDEPLGARLAVVAATDGNHGRAVARFARRLGHRARIVLPAGVSTAAAGAIEAEGAELTRLDGSYDEAVATAAALARQPDTLLVQDTSWDGYTEIPGWIVEGYTTLFAETDAQLDAFGVPAPDLVFVPTGVGSLLQAALSHYRRGDGPVVTTAVVSVEAEAAACVAVSLAAGRPVTVATRVTAMAGLNCGTLSELAWPHIRAGLDGAAAVGDDEDLRAARDLARLGVHAGPCGAASLAAARLVLTGPDAEGRRAHLGVDATSTVVLVSTESVEANPLTDGL